MLRFAPGFFESGKVKSSNLLLGSSLAKCNFNIFFLFIQYLYANGEFREQAKKSYYGGVGPVIGLSPFTPYRLHAPRALQLAANDV